MLLSWLYLLIGSVAAVAGQYLLKNSNGFEYVWTGIAALVLFVAGISLYGVAVKLIPLTIAYIVWTGVSVTMVTLMGVLLFGDTLSPTHIIFMLMIIIGMLGLKMVTQ